MPFPSCPLCLGPLLSKHMEQGDELTNQEKNQRDPAFELNKDVKPKKKKKGGGEK